MVSLKQRQSGFTIVELLIVIVIIGILATLVIVTFSGVQQRARDSERKTDINAIAGQLEAFYATNGYYPLEADLESTSYRSTNEIRLDIKAFADPSTPGTTTLSTGVASGKTGANTGKVYYYQTFAEDKSTACTGADSLTAKCPAYKISANLEGKDPSEFYIRESN